LPSGSDWSASFASATTDALSFYDEIMVPRLFDPWAELLLDELNPQSGQAVLDVACGPGTVARRAARHVGTSGRVTGCDLSPAMLDLARSKSPDASSAPISYLQCPADSLSVADHDFDLVTCQQGLQFFGDRIAALTEMRRALKSGGRLGVSVWSNIEDCPPFAALATALDEVMNSETATAYRLGPWGLGDSASIVQSVTESGFDDVTVRRIELPLIFDGGPRQLMLTLRAAAVATTLAELTEAELERLARAVDKATQVITVDGAIRSYATSHIVTASVGS